MTTSLTDSLFGWWQALATAEQVFYGIALISGFIILILGLMSVIGFELHNFDIDHPDIGDGSSLFSLKPIIGFMFAFGWAGGAALDHKVGLGVTIVLALAAGVACMLLVGWTLKATRHLRSNGNINKSTAVGKIASVYVTIPPANAGAGQVTIPLDGRTITMEAVQTGSTPLPASAKVRILALIDNTTARVEAVN